jgi:hypothetical protein
LQLKTRLNQPKQCNVMPLACEFDPQLSLCQLLDSEVLANPYPLYRKLRTQDPVHWDPFLHAWVITRYTDVMKVLQDFSANCAPEPQQLADMGLSTLNTVAQIMVRQMLFMDPPAHTQLRAIASAAFTPRRVEVLRSHIEDIVNGLLDAVQESGHMDVMSDLANQLPAIVTAELLGVSSADHKQLKAWSADFAEVLGNFQHNADQSERMLRTVEEMSAYFRAVIRQRRGPSESSLISALSNAEIQGEHLTEDVVIANAILITVGGQETTPNLIGNGILALLRTPDQLQRLRTDLSLLPSAIEELLRYESPSQHTTRLAPKDTELRGKQIRKGQSVIAVMGAANRDPERFSDPDRLDVARPNNRHLAFGAGAHFCFGAHLGRLEGQITIGAMLRRLASLALEAGPLTWRQNLGLRGLSALPVTFESSRQNSHPVLPN